MLTARRFLAALALPLVLVVAMAAPAQAKVADESGGLTNVYSATFTGDPFYGNVADRLAGAAIVWTQNWYKPLFDNHPNSCGHQWSMRLRTNGVPGTALGLSSASFDRAVNINSGAWDGQGFSGGGYVTISGPLCFVGAGKDDAVYLNRSGPDNGALWYVDWLNVT